RDGLSAVQGCAEPQRVRGATSPGPTTQGRVRQQPSRLVRPSVDVGHQGTSGGREMPLFDRKPRGREILERRNGPREETPIVGATPDAKERGQTAYYELKTRIHGQLIERLDLAKLDALPRELVQQQIRRIVEDMLALDETPLSRKERDDLVIEIEHETFG